MKVVGFSDFLELPPGTIYCEYTPDYASGLYIKGLSIGQDDQPDSFFYQNLIPQDCKLEVLEVFRWDKFDESDQFIIYEAEDIKILLSWLKFSLDESERNK